MKKFISKYLSIFLISSTLLTSCEIANFDLLDNPNYLTPDRSNTPALLNEMQFLFQVAMSDLTVTPNSLMRYEVMTRGYNDEISADVLNTEWERYYEALYISRQIKKDAESDPIYTYHNAMSQLMMDYLTITMVDFIGSIPYSEAANPVEFPTPKADSGVDLYKLVLKNIDASINDLNNATISADNDLFYNGNKTKWIAFANSFKLRILIQSRLASSQLGITDLKAEINNLINTDIIDIEAEDFVYKHATVEIPESRHRFFRRGYLTSATNFIGNNFMWLLKDSKPIEDPRIRYYLYRQSNINPFTNGPPYLPCANDANVVFCYVGAGYWGLDHGETRTGRGDQLLRTTYGIYPGGGAFDEDQFIQANQTTNLQGAGIIPILTSSYIKFLLAESALELGTNGDPKALLEEAIRASMQKVLNFGNVSSPFAATNTDVNTYVTEVMNSYDSATSNADRLNIIITEFYLAAFGNSIDIYNAYRRTGFPSNLQVPINDPNPTFPRSFFYALSELLYNTTLTQKLSTEKVFWDTNPDDFIK